MLRPATPLTILLFAAFVLLLISVISTPIIKAIPLGTESGVDFGVFGFCKADGSCSKIEIGYDTSSLLSSDAQSSFDIPLSTRTTLTSILIVHPVAALFTLIMLILAATAHFHSPSHSPRYLLGVFILSVVTFVAALLSFLIDVLLFAPHMAWGSYLVLAATILIAASGIVSCAMRRTLVSRKARKRRIAENAEMNGENFYNRQGGDGTIPPTTDGTMMTSATAVDKLPSFATFEVQKKEEERTSDERIPLTTRTPTGNSPINGEAVPLPQTDQYGQPRNGGSPQRDQYGNIIPGAYGSRSRDPSADPSLNRQYSENSMNARGRGYGPRGRGGYPPNGRGGYGPPRGGYGPPRGGYGPPPRGGYGGYRGGMNDPLMVGGLAPGPSSRGRGGPPPGYRGGYDNRRPPYGRGASNDGYAVPPPVGQYAAYNPDNDDSHSSLPRAESPPPMSGLESEIPVGQAVEMDATTGSPQKAPRGFGQFGNLRDSDGDVAGMVGLQQQRMQRETVSSISRYSTDNEPYVPPRQVWGGNGRSSPLNSTSPAAELGNTTAPGHRRASSDYYEDQDPRFVERPSALPAPLGVPRGDLQPLQPPRIGGLDGSASYEDLQSGSRSPAESDKSNFTSISQRGVNPRWNGNGGYGAPMPARRPVQQSAQALDSNPDFALPGARGPRINPPRAGSRNQGPQGSVINSAYPSSGVL